jgi:hypothetical protein
VTAKEYFTAPQMKDESTYILTREIKMEGNSVGKK